MHHDVVLAWLVSCHVSMMPQRYHSFACQMGNPSISLDKTFACILAPSTPRVLRGRDQHLFQCRGTLAQLYVCPQVCKYIKNNFRVNKVKVQASMNDPSIDNSIWLYHTSVWNLIDLSTYNFPHGWFSCCCKSVHCRNWSYLFNICRQLSIINVSYTWIINTSYKWWGTFL